MGVLLSHVSIGFIAECKVRF